MKHILKFSKKILQKMERIQRHQREIWKSHFHISRGEIQKRREQLNLSGRETYQLLNSLSGKDLLVSQPVQDVLAYTTDWDPFIVNKQPKVTPNTPGIQVDPRTGEIALPYPFIVVSKQGKESWWGERQFYWDMYFINKALVASGRPEYMQIAINHVENFQFLFDRLGYIPNASQLSIINRTQMPFLTGMISDIYEATHDQKWLAKKMELAKREYHDVWMYTEQEGREKGIKRPSSRISEESSLVRFVGTDVVTEHYPAAAASTRDDSAQWARRAYELLPVSLNSTLYKYEKDFAYAARELGNLEESERWEKAASKRKKEMNELFWHEKMGMYFDATYNRRKNKWQQDRYISLDTFMPLWVDIATEHQADKVINNLYRFESPYGLFIAPKNSLPDERWAQVRNIVAHGAFGRSRRFIPALNDAFKPQQWDYPNIWAPMEYFAFEGMLNYGKNQQAQLTLEKVIRSAAAFFQERGTLSEKINGLTGFNGSNYHYGNQEGFGFHNAVVTIAAGRLHQLTRQPQDYATMVA